MLNEVDAQRKSVCCICEVNVAGELTQVTAEIYRRYALCPECWNSHITNDSRKNAKVPVQFGLPLIGTMPKIITMSALAFGTMVIHDSRLLKDCTIVAVYKGPFCQFDVICQNEVTRDGIRKFLAGTEG